MGVEEYITNPHRQFSDCWCPGNTIFLDISGRCVDDCPSCIIPYYLYIRDGEHKVNPNGRYHVCWCTGNSACLGISNSYLDDSQSGLITQCPYSWLWECITNQHGQYPVSWFHRPINVQYRHNLMWSHSSMLCGHRQLLCWWLFMLDITSDSIDHLNI